MTTTHGIAQASQNSAAGVRKSVDRSAGAARTGSVILVLLVAALLVGAAAAFVVLGRSSAEPYILVFLAVLATVGVFSLFALASGILRLPAAEAGQPIDQDGRR